MFKDFFPDVVWKKVHRKYAYILRTYGYRSEIIGVQGISEKLPLLLKSLWQTYIDRKKILFYPEGPRKFHVLYKVLTYLGYTITLDPKKKCDVAIKWWVAFDGNPLAPEGPFPSIDKKGENGTKLLNMQCNDISKTRVNAAFEEIFGYPIAVDPVTHQGKCVMKLDWNALHKGQTIECPVKTRKDGFVYQKLIRNETDNGFVEDMRVPVFKNNTPFIYLKYRSVKDRFIDRDHTNTKATIAEVADRLTLEELNNVHRFCERIGMDYGEVDVLRDRDDERIYIVDANNTPSGPPTPISKDEAKVAVLRLSRAFEETFGK